MVLSLFGHATIPLDADVLDVGTGSGYGAGLLARRLGDHRITSIDVDPYLTKVAAERLDGVGLRPRIATVDGTGAVPGAYDRIVATVSVRPIPAGWLAALRPGGRLVTTITNCSMIIVADKTPDGGAVGHVARDWAMFMTTRTGEDYPDDLNGMFEQVRDQDGDEVTVSAYPVVNVIDAWELRTMVELTAPDIEHYFEEEDGTRTAWMLHADGSWARAVDCGDGRTTVHQGGPRRLWDVLEEVRSYWLQHGSLPIYGATARVTPDGTVHLRRGGWKATIRRELVPEVM
ncbi:methyltransferase domain-containing protein [Streptosporangium sp. NPDC000563]|uniref:methyltransferase domain-containing protein n=1 Tax=Streptosporangium sp. NPDC000563 TaxID=3154366 RepID=UPI00331D6414